MNRFVRLRTARIKKNLSLSEAAHLASVSIHTYRKWETHTSPSTLDGVVRLCHILDISLDYYLLGTDLGGVDSAEKAVLNWFNRLSATQKDGFLALIGGSSYSSKTKVVIPDMITPSNL